MSSSVLFARECAAAAPWPLPLRCSGTSSNSAPPACCSFGGSRRELYRRRIFCISPSSPDFQRTRDTLNSSSTLKCFNSAGALLRSATFGEGRPIGKLTIRVRAENEIRNGTSGGFSDFHRKSQTSRTLTHYRLNNSTTLKSFTSAGAFNSGFGEGRPGRLTSRVRAENESRIGASGDEEVGDVSDVDPAGGDAREDGSKGREEGGISGVRDAVTDAVKRFSKEFARELKNETGFDSEAARDGLVAEFYEMKENIGDGLVVAQDVVQTKVDEVREGVKTAVKDVRHKYWPQFVNWNRIELWKDRTQWDVQRAGALIFYILLFGAFVRGALMISTARSGKKAIELTTDNFLESVIPEPTAANVRKYRKALWRENMPKGFNVRKYKIGEFGEREQDYSFPGDQPEEADDPDFDADRAIDESDLFTSEEKEQLKRDIAESKSTDNMEKIDDEGGFRARVDITKFIDRVDNMTPEEKEQLKKEIAEERARQASERSQSATGQEEDNINPGAVPNSTWQERLAEWNAILQRENVRENLDIASSKYEVDVSWPALIEDIERGNQEGAEVPKSMRAFWVARKWWKHRPKLPYTYFLAKVLNQEVRAAVYTEDMKTLYVTMKEGFPTEYVVDIPVDPTLYAMLEAAGVEIDTLYRSNWYYYGRILFAILPSLLIIWYIQEWHYQTRQRASEKMYDLLSMNRQHLILPEDAADKARSQYKDVVVGGDVYQVIDEIMIYMRNPMKYHNRRVKLPRGILISGPPGTGKTLLARAIARESGLPFVFASGAEFMASGTATGTDKIFDIFFTARANAPSFVFIDEIDALAGKGVKDDAERRATFEQLLSELDAEPEDTDVDRFAPRQAVILICATNRPDELDEEFMRPGRIDREIHIGLPGEEERLGIFKVHSEGKPIANDVDFTKLVFRTIGYSGADIRNLINEAGIMAVRKGHDEISQQDIVDVLDKQLFEGMGVVLMDEEQEQAEQKIPEDNKRLLAVHEAGHVLLAHLFPSFDWHAFSHLLPGGSETALSVFYPKQEMLELGHTTVGYVMMQMVVAHGGRCAERLIFGDDISDGGQDDLARISSMARELTISPANTRFGLYPMKWRETMDPPKLPGEVELIPNEWDKPGTQIANMSVEMSELFTREVTKCIEETEETAMTALSQNRHILERLADELFSKTKMSGLEAEDIIRSMNPVLLPDYMNCSPKMDFKSFEEKAAPPKMRGRYEEMTIYPAPLPDF